MKLKVKKAKSYNVKTQQHGFKAIVVSNGSKSFEEIAKESCRNTTLHAAEAELASKLLIEKIAEYLREGFIVDLGPVGKLRPGCNSKWVATEAEVRKDDVRPHVLFDPSDEVEGAIKAATLVMSGVSEDDADGSDHSGDNEQGGGQGGDDDPDGGGALS